MTQKNLKVQIADLEQKVASSSEYDIFYALAQAYFDDGQYDKVREFIQYKLFIKFPENASNYCLFAKALSNQGKYDEAISKIYKALEISPDDIEAKITLGKIFYHKGKFEQAFEIFQKLESELCENRDVKFYLGLLYSQKDEQEKVYPDGEYI